jgi:two-component system, OmpR family, alkaline phosphatase synthesis response regulator PhoP
MTEISSPHILIIEDDPDIAGLLEIHMADLHFETTVVADGIDGYREAQKDHYDLIIQDLMLPGMDGMDICKKIRSEGNSVPVLMLTARSDEMDKIIGLELGADDYLTKPFSIRELVARVKALLRRSDFTAQAPESADTDRILVHRDLSVDLDRRRALLRGDILDLTAKEWDLLVLFTRNPGRIYSRQELLDLVWGYQYDGYSHTVNSHINRLRNKIEDVPAEPTYIVTRRGMGYLFTEST